MFGSELQSALTAMGLSVTEEQLRQFDVFHEQLIETNKVMNLTAITEPKEVAIKHMADSLSCYEADCFTPGASVLDLGTGAGFPGLPLLIYRPDLKVTFFDSLQKRLTFCRTWSINWDLLPISFTVGPKRRPISLSTAVPLTS